MSNLRGETTDLAHIDDASITPTTTVAPESEAPTELDVADGSISTEVEFEGASTEKVLSAEIYDKARLKDDGRLGIPIFTDGELAVLSKNIKIDISAIEAQQTIMHDMLATIKTAEESGETDIDQTVSLYNAARNMLITYQKSYDEYIDFINQNKEELLSFVNSDAMKIVNAYIEDMSKKYDIKYTDGSLKAFIVAIHLKKLLNGDINDTIDLVFGINSKIEFVDAIERITRNAFYFIANVSNDSDIDNLSREEREVSKLMTSMIHTFNKFKTNNQPVINNELFDGVDQKELLISHVKNLSTLMNKKVYTFNAERRKYNRKLKQFREQDWRNRKNVNLPLDGDLIRLRFSAFFLETFMKNLFSVSMFNDKDVMNSQELFTAKADDVAAYTAKEAFTSIITSVSYRFLFDELATVIADYATDNVARHLDSKDIAVLKNYILFVVLAKESTKKSDYDLETLYIDYINKIIGRFLKS